MEILALALPWVARCPVFPTQIWSWRVCLSSQCTKPKNRKKKKKRKPVAGKWTDNKVSHNLQVTFMLCGSENRTQATTGTGEFSCNGTILLSLYIQYAVLCQELFFFSCFRSCFSSLFCFCPVLHKVQVQFLETRTPSWQIGKLMLSFLMSQTLSELWLVPSNLMKSCLKPSHLKEKKGGWVNHFTKEFHKL